MSEEILTEITDYCSECPNHENCPEEDCVLYRIEKIVEGSEVKNERLDGE